MNWHQIHDTLRYEEMELALGIDITYRTANEHMGRCPLPSHGGPDRNPSFSINSEKGIYNCFSCGGGILPQLVMELEEMTFDDALHWLSGFSDSIVDNEVEAFVKQLEGWASRGPQPVERDHDLPWYSPYALPKEEPGGTEFFEGRNIGRDTVNKFDLRYCHHERHGYEGPCVIIPHMFGGELRGWQERWLDFGTEDFPKSIPKYTNTDSFPKRETVYRFDTAGEEFILVESALTVATLDTYGLTACATFGASVSPEQIRILRAARRIYLAFDNDVAGQKAVRNLMDGLDESVDLWIVPAPVKAKGDLGDLPKDEVERLLDSAYSSAFYSA